MAKCPVCGGELVENDKTIQCEHCFPEKACDFTLWKESTKKFFGVNLTMKLVEKILGGDEIEITRKSKAGNDYTGTYTIAKNDKGFWGLEMTGFANKDKK